MISLDKHEEDVIGCLLADQSISLYACNKVGLTPECFVDSFWGNVYANMLEMDKARIPLTPINVDTYIVTRGGEPVREKCMDALNACITATHCEYYAKILVDRHARIKTVAMLKDAAEKVENDETKSVQEHTESIFQDMLTLERHSKIKISKVHQHKDEVLKKWEAASKADYIGVPSSIKTINSYLGGWRNCLGIIGAYRGVGKSTFIRQECLHQARLGLKVLLFTLEDQDEIAASRIAGNIADVSAFHCDIGTASSSDIDKMAEAFDSTKDLTLWMVNDAYTIEEIMSTCSMMKQRHGLDIVYIDHIQYIAPQQLPNMNRVNTMSAYSHQLAMACKRFGCPIVCASQFSRECEKENRTPRLSDLRDSGSLEQDARQILLLYPDLNDDMYHLEVAKNNYGVSGKDVKIERLDGKQRFEERTEIL